MKRLILLGFLLIISFSKGEEQDVAKIVIDFRSGDLHIFENYLINGLANNIQYYRDNLKELKVVVVVHGDGYKFFVKNLDKSPYKNEIQLKKKRKELKERLENLVKFYGVRFEMCKAGMKARGISEDNIYPFVKPVYSALVGLVYWQNKGYAYMVFQ